MLCRADGVPKFPRATSVVVFKSSDGWDWVYQGTIANATDYAFSQVKIRFSRLGSG